MKRVVLLFLQLSLTLYLFSEPPSIAYFKELLSITNDRDVPDDFRFDGDKYYNIISINEVMKLFIGSSVEWFSFDDSRNNRYALYDALNKKYENIYGKYTHLLKNLENDILEAKVYDVENGLYSLVVAITINSVNVYFFRRDNL
jgi:hypothetical protein